MEMHNVMNKQSWEASAEIMEHDNETSLAVQNDNFEHDK